MSSANVSKIPVVKSRRLSPERPLAMSPAMSPQKSVSKLPVKVSRTEVTSTSSRQYKENICDVAWKDSASPVMSPSRIPVMKNQNQCDRDPAAAEYVTPRHHSSSSASSYASQLRPQSIDLEDEYFSSKSYILSPSPEKLQQVRKMSDPKIGFSPQRKISPLSAQVTNSRIPISTDYYSKSDRPRPSPPRSSSSSSLKMSPVSDRVERDSEKSMSRTRSTDYISGDSGTSNDQVCPLLPNLRSCENLPVVNFWQILAILT